MTGKHLHSSAFSLLLGVLATFVLATPSEAITITTGNLVPNPPISLDASNPSADSFDFEIDLGVTFASLSSVTISNVFESSDPYDNGEGWRISVGGGGIGQTNVFETNLSSVTGLPSGHPMLPEFLDGQLSSTYTITDGSFDLSSLTFTFVGEVVPEPATATLLAFGLSALALRARCRRAKW